MLPPTRIAVGLLAAGFAATALGACSYALLDSDTTAGFNQSGRPAWAKPADPPPSAIAAPQTIDGLMNAAEVVAEPPPAAPASKSYQAEPATRPGAAAASSLFAAARPIETRPLEPVQVARAPAADRALEPPPPAVQRRRIEPRGRAYLFRGVGGLIYSTGMDRLAEEIKRTGVKADVNTYLMWRVVVADAIQAYRKDHAPITIIGHSAGGDSAVAFAYQLNNAGIPVNLLVTYDPTRIAADVPPNVERFINIYQSRNIMGGGDVTAGHGFHGHYASINLKDHGEIIHINIEKSERIHAQLVRKIAELAATPADTQGEKIPIRYVPPARAAIDLWDSGMPVLAAAGDTLPSLAAAHQVPVWALAQVNRLPEGARLKPGQRIVVPRYLMPADPPADVPVSSLPPSGR
jgi:hypothetical protein